MNEKLDENLSLKQSIKVSLSNWTFPVITLVITAVVIPLQIVSGIPDTLLCLLTSAQSALVIMDRNRNGKPDHDKWVVDIMIIIVSLSIGANTLIFAINHNLTIGSNAITFLVLLGSILSMVGAESVLQAKLRTLREAQNRFNLLKNSIDTSKDVLKTANMDYCPRCGQCFNCEPPK